jgi:flagellar basal-body rod protein FlgF
MPLQGIINTARSLSYFTRVQEVTANNLANVQTDAFKVDRITARLLPGSEHPVPVETTDLRQGTFKETSRPLDVSLDGPGFFVVQTSQGERLTRGGSMRLDAAGQLTDGEGHPLLSETGPIVLNGGDVTIGSDGTVEVDGASAGRLRLATVENPSTLQKEGSGRYVATTPLLPVADDGTRVKQGSVEEPNSDPLLSMMDLVTVQRAFSANLDALRAMDGVLGVVTGEVGKV